MLVLKICGSEWKNASRDKRELSVCREIGLDTAVLAKGTGNDKGKKEVVDNYCVYRYSTRPIGWAPASLNRFFALFTWAKFVKQLEPDIISGHDWVGLLIGYIYLIFYGKKKKTSLIYDSHEFELGRNAERSWFKAKAVKALEGFLIKRASMSIMVSDIIADEVQKIYKLKERPLVVRSIPETWHVDEETCRKKREEYIKNMSAGNEVELILMYHGAITSGRGIEKTLQIVKEIPKTGLVILGDASVEAYKLKIKELIDNLGIKGRVYMHAAVPHKELWEYVGAADVGMINLDAICKSYYFALPNKFFENIQAGTPVVVSDFPELSKIVRKYDIGWIVKDDIEDNVRCVRELLDRRQDIAEKKANVIKAKEELCWEKEKNILINGYTHIVNLRKNIK